MTDRETIFDYRMRQTEETLAEAVKMQENRVGRVSVA